MQHLKRSLIIGIIGKRLLTASVWIFWLCVSATPSIAHETWILPASKQFDPNTRTRFDLTSGMTFPKLESPIRRDRVANAVLTLNGKSFDQFDFPPSDKSLCMEIAPAGSGIAVMSMSLKPKQIELTDTSVEEYFQEINAASEIRTKWESIRGKKPWKELYTKHAKTILAIGDSGKDEAWAEPAGLKLEFVPCSNPVTWKQGSEFECKLLKDGKPLPNLQVGMMKEGDSKREFVLSDSNGKVKLTSNHTGWFLIYTVELRYREDGTWESDFSTLVAFIN